MAKQLGGNKRPFAVKVAPRDLAAVKRHEPQPVDIEFSIQDAVQILSPSVVRVYKNMRCENFITPTQMNMPNVQNSARYDKSKQGILLMEYATGGSLDSWMKKRAHVNDAVMSHIISDILKALFKIQIKYPDFRHNDLHMQNVFVADRGFLIGDFGWARLKKSGTNPAVNTANGTKTASFWGVGPKTDERYDHHLFLNEMLDWAMKHSPADHPKAIEFLKRAIPEGYRGETNSHVIQWRLKYGDPCTGLPSLARLVKDSFLTGKRNVTSPNLKAAKARLRLVKVKRILSLNLQKAKAALKPANRRKPGRLITSAKLLKAKAALKRVARPKPKPRITGYNLRAAKARLRKVQTVTVKPKVNDTARKATTAFGGGLAVKKNKHKPFPREVLRSTKFNKMVTKVYEERGRLEGGGNFQNAWNKARRIVINKIQERINTNKPAFTPSPPKPRNLPPPLSPLGPPKPKPKAPSPPKVKPKAKNSNFKLSPSSGRAKVKSNSSGRWVYANLHFSMEELKRMAALRGVNTKGLRSKADFARKIFGSV
jgi:serine/threonine protein kinase